MGVRINAPVGLRNRDTNVTNAVTDQATIIGLLASIAVSDGGQREHWSVPPLAGPDGSCPPTLVDAIWDFQVFWKQAGRLRVVDGVVDPDKSTLACMNDHAVPLPITPATVVDVIVKLQGTRRQPNRPNEGAEPLTEKEVFPTALLTGYNMKPGRQVKRIGQRTVTIREKSARLIADHVTTIKSIARDELGEVFIYGSSSGGRNAVDLAAALTREGIRVRYIAALDAAYYPDESQTQPDNISGEPTIVPLFSPSGIVQAVEAESWFQRVGNHSKLTLLHGLMFTSDMDGKEVHGAIQGFTSQDLTEAVQVQAPDGDDDAHVKLWRAAAPLVQAKIAAILNTL